jgi:protein-tyrosine phosphatase
MVPFTQTQTNRLIRFDTDQSVDVHCHCLPGIDDGPRTTAEAVDLCRALVGDGITTVVATPHQLGAYELRNHGAMIRQRVAELRATLEAEAVPLNVLPGAEVRIDERIPWLLDAGDVVTVGDAGSHMLLELPQNQFVDPSPLIRTLARAGVCAVITHPERLPEVVRRPTIVRRWVDAGGLLQVTAASLAGRFGADAEQVAWGLIAAGLVAIVATDAHGARHRSPRMSQAIALLEERHGWGVTAQLCVDGPRRLVRPHAIPARRSGLRQANDLTALSRGEVNEQ